MKSHSPVVRRKGYFIGSMLFALSITAFSISVCRASAPVLQTDIETVLAEEGLAGIAWSLIDEEGEVRLGAAGLRDNQARFDFTVDTRFHVGSVTKSLLATGVLRLVTEGLVELDAPASLYLPALSFSNPWGPSAEVTVRHLLDHTSGLNDASLWQMFSERSDPDALLIAAFPDPDTQLQIRTRPGSRFSYSNMGYTLLGLIIESVTGLRYEDYLNQQLLAPLNMRDSTFSFTTQIGENADPGLAWGHVDDGSRYAASPVFLRPAAQFTTTAGDLATFARFLLGDGTVKGRTFIGRGLMLARGRPESTQAANSGLAAGYALGLGRRDRYGVVGYCHGGNIVGFVAMLCIFPSENKGFSYSVNTDSETADYGRIDKLLIDALAVTDAVQTGFVEPAEDVSEWLGWYIPSPNRFQAFEYLDTVFGAVEIHAEEESLTMTPLQGSSRRLSPVGELVFSASDRATASHVFLRGDQNEYLVSDGFTTFRKVSTAYLAAHWASIVLGMTGLCWLLMTGLVALVRRRGRIFGRPETPAFFTVILLFVPIPLFFTQSFMALGDSTPASVSLALSTALLPLGMLGTLFRAWTVRNGSRFAWIHGLAAAFALQWCVVLAVAGLLPLRLWA